MAEKKPALPLSEAVYRAALERSPIANILVTRDGLIALVNAQAESMFGYSREELVGKPIEVLVPKSVRARHPPMRDGYFKDPKVRYMGVGRDLAGTRKDGSEFPVEIALNPIKTEDGDYTMAAVSDISERSRAEEKFRAVVEAAPTAMIMINEAGDIVLTNAQAEKLFGYTRNELLGLKVDALVPDANRKGHPKLRDGFFTDPRPRTMGAGRELFGKRKDGSLVPVEIGLNPIQTSEGKFAIAAIADITERRRAEEKFRSVVEAAPTAMIMINESGDIVLTNAQVDKLFGYAREELLGKKVDMLVPEMMRPGHPKLRDSFFTAPRPRTMGAGRELHGLRKDGSLVPVEIGLNPIVTSEGRFAIAAIADITERRRAEEKFRAVVESAPNAMVMIDTHGIIVLTNNQAEKLFGYQRSELVGQAIEILVPKRIRERHPGLRMGFFTDPRPRMMGIGRDLTGARKDGSEFPVEIGLNPIETSEGRFAIAAIADITERVEREKLLQRQRDEIMELSTPVMQVWDKVLALPIIGTLDSQRAARLTENLLQKIGQDEAEFVILDISGVPTIDSQVAQNLLKTVQGARLMGADCILSGVRPETAQAMVHLGIDIGALRSRSTMRDALQLALALRKDPEAVTLRGGG